MGMKGYATASLTNGEMLPVALPDERVKPRAGLACFYSRPPGVTPGGGVNSINSREHERFRFIRSSGSEELTSILSISSIAVLI